MEALHNVVVKITGYGDRLSGHVLLVLSEPFVKGMRTIALL